MVYQISEGPRVETATIITDGRQHTQQSLIDQQVKIRTGEPLSENAMLSSESHLYNLGIFDWAEVDPSSNITDQTHEDVVVKVHEAKRNFIVYGFGFQVLNRGGAIPSGTVAVPGLPPVGLPGNFVTSQKTFWGPDGTFEYTRRNMRGQAETFTFSAFAGRLDQRGSLNYTQPSFFGTKWNSSAILSGEHNEQNPIFTDRIGSVGYQFKRPLNQKKTTNLFFRYNFQYTDVNRLLIPELVPSNQLNVHLSTLTASWVHDTRDNVLDAHRGCYQNYEFDVSPYWMGSNFSFAQLVSQTAYYKNIGKGIIWANSLRIGLEQPFDGSEVPLSSSFFAGGGSTLRGFPLDGAGPQREIPVCGIPGDLATCSKITVPNGGNELLIINTELRWPLDQDQARPGHRDVLRRRQRLPQDRLSRLHVALQQQRGYRIPLRDSGWAHPNRHRPQLESGSWNQTYTVLHNLGAGILMAIRDLGLPPDEPQKPYLVPPRKPSRAKKIVFWIAGVLDLLLLVLAVGIYVALHSAAVHNYVLKTVQQKASQSLNTRVELQNYALHPSTLGLDLYGLTIYGVGPGANQPLLQVDHIGLGVRVISVLHRQWNLAERHRRSSGRQTDRRFQRSEQSSDISIQQQLQHQYLRSGDSPHPARPRRDLLQRSEDRPQRRSSAIWPSSPITTRPAAADISARCPTRTASCNTEATRRCRTTWPPTSTRAAPA